MPINEYSTSAEPLHIFAIARVNLHVLLLLLLLLMCVICLLDASLPYTIVFMPRER